MFKSTLRRVKAGFIEFLKSVFGLPLYTGYLIAGRIPKKTRFALSEGIYLAWGCVAILGYACAFHPPELPKTDVRAMCVLVVALIMFAGLLIHLKAQRDRLMQN